jgi:hypothetical protein
MGKKTCTNYGELRVTLLSLAFDIRILVGKRYRTWTSQHNELGQGAAFGHPPGSPPEGSRGAAKQGYQDKA